MKKNFWLVSALILSLMLALFLGACSNKDEPENTVCEHKWQDVEVVHEATCETVGTLKQKCTKCNATQETEISALGHTFDETNETRQNDESGHWLVCKRDGCNAKSNTTAHNFTNHKCDVCNWVAPEYTNYTEGLSIEYKPSYKQGDSIPGEVYYVKAYTGTATEVKIPYYYNDGTHGLQPVKAIGTDAFVNRTEITAIDIPDSVIIIAHNSALKDTAWFNAQEEGVVYAGKIAFTYKGTMPNNYDLVLKNDTLAIAEWAFNSQQSLKSVVIPDSVTWIGRYSFQNCMALETVSIGSGVETIAVAAFTYCEALTEIHIPNNVKVLNNQVFSYCKSLTTVTFGNGITQLGDDVFTGTNLLTSITFDCTLAKLKEVTKDGAIWYKESNKNLVITCTDGTFKPYHAAENGQAEYWEDLKTGTQYPNNQYTNET